MITRRGFLKFGFTAGAGLFLTSKFGSRQRVFALSIPGGSLDPLAVPKYQTPLVIPPAMPRSAVLNANGEKIDYYEIAVRQFQQHILPESMNLPKTTVWSYGSETTAGTYNYPAFTIEARQDRPVRVKWINQLVDANGNYLPHLLPVDPTLHWANPPGGLAERDMRPTFGETPGPYTGPVPLVPHVHGAVGVGDESDGYAEAWYLPAASNIPLDYATVGTWYDTFAAKAVDKFGTAWGPGYCVYTYPNANRASTIWYHDHALGMTRLNVYAGPAGFYIIRGGPSDQVKDSRSGTAAVLPGPAPALGDAPGQTYYEIPIAVQDRSFNGDGSLFYPDSREFFDGATALIPGFIPGTDLSPIWNPEFFGNMIVVNGKTWPFLNVEQRRYRFRFLDGCQSRFLILDFSNIPGVEVWQIGNEGGFLAAPVNITGMGNRLLMSLAERADLIVDFTNVPLGQHILANIGPDEPFGGGVPGVDFPVSDPDSTGQIMAFNVVPAIAPDPSTPPQFLTLPAIPPFPAPRTTRTLALLEMMSMDWDGPAEAMLGQVGGDGMPMHQMWSEPVTEKPVVGDTEVWEMYNFTADAHPMHVHEVTFEVVDRQALELDPITGEPVQPVALSGAPRPPEAWENGLKDTVIAYPGEVTRIRAQFNIPGQFVWHCHIVEHEDNEMMRPYAIDQLGGFPRTAILDNFNRPTGRLGGSWIGPATIGQVRFRIQGFPPDGYVRVLSGPAGLFSYMFWDGGSFGGNQEAFVTLTRVSPTASEHTLLLKATGLTLNGLVGLKTALIAVGYDATTNQVQVKTMEPRLRWAVQKTFTGITFANGDILGARALADGEVIVFKNGNAIGSHYLTSGPNPWLAPLAKGGGQVGVWFAGSFGLNNEARFDNFGGGTL